MIDEYNDDRTGWARFSDDLTMRFRLARSLDGRPLTINEPGIIECDLCVTFLLLNPSVASAFINDPTVVRCAGFAKDLGADVYQVANINALRSTDPKELYKRATGYRGDDAENDWEILHACVGVHRVIAGYGVHGALGGRGERVVGMLRAEGIKVSHLGMTKDGHPRHPLYLKRTTQACEWEQP